MLTVCFCNLDGTDTLLPRIRNNPWNVLRTLSILPVPFRVVVLPSLVLTPSPWVSLLRRILHVRPWIELWAENENKLNGGYSPTTVATTSAWAEAHQMGASSSCRFWQWWDKWRIDDTISADPLVSSQSFSKFVQGRVLLPIYFVLLRINLLMLEIGCEHLLADDAIYQFESPPFHASPYIEPLVGSESNTAFQHIIPGFNVSFSW